jgi:polygalacturonase
VGQPLRSHPKLQDLQHGRSPYRDLEDMLYEIARGIGMVLHNQHVLYDKLVSIDRKEQAEMATLDDLTQAVADATTVDESIIVLLDNIAAQLANAQQDPARIQSVIDTINAEKQRVADAVVRNTSAAPEA